MEQRIAQSESPPLLFKLIVFEEKNALIMEIVIRDCFHSFVN